MFCYLSAIKMIINMAKTHTLIVRGVTKDQKNALKRMAKRYSVKQSVNQVMLAMISTQTHSEIKEFNNNKK